MIESLTHCSNRALTFFTPHENDGRTGISYYSYLLEGLFGFECLDRWLFLRAEQRSLPRRWADHKMGRLVELGSKVLLTDSIFHLVASINLEKEGKDKNFWENMVLL